MSWCEIYRSALHSPNQAAARQDQASSGNEAKHISAVANITGQTHIANVETYLEATLYIRLCLF